jgi:single-stranded DNA-binding protein
VLAGRVGADPTFRTTPKGTLVGRFSLAVHGPDHATTWFPVVAFNQRAERLRDSVKRGVAVNVVGYVHSRETGSRDGSPRTIREIYAVSVTPPRAQ